MDYTVDSFELAVICKVMAQSVTSNINASSDKISDEFLSQKSPKLTSWAPPSTKEEFQAIPFPLNCQNLIVYY